MMARRPFAFIAIFLLSAVISACTQVHSVAISPEVFVNPSPVGDNKLVGVKVTDQRPSSLIGKGTTPFVKLRKFKIETRSGLTEHLEEKMREALRRLGFRPKPYADEERRRLTVDLLVLKDEYVEEGSGYKESVKVALRAFCQGRAGGFKNEYREMKQEEHALVMTNFPNEKLINLTVSLAMKKMFQDERLTSCLAR